MKQEILEDVMRYLTPQFKFIINLTLNKQHSELKALKKRVLDGLKKGMIEFHPKEKDLNLDLNKLKKEKGKEWFEVLKKQLDIIVDLIEKFAGGK